MTDLRPGTQFTAAPTGYLPTRFRVAASGRIMRQDWRPTTLTPSDFDGVGLRDVIHEDDDRTVQVPVRHGMTAPKPHASEQWYVVASRRRGDPADNSWIVEGDRVTYGAVNSTGELIIDLIERPIEDGDPYGPTIRDVTRPKGDDRA